MDSASTASGGLNRRQLLGSAAAAAGGGFGAGWTLASAPVVSVHLDVPFVDPRGAAAPYRPPMRSAAEAGLVDPHELA
jgi:hypothetical protein